MSKRTKILVDPDVQWSIARRIILHWMLLLVCLTSISVMVRLMFSVGEQSFGDSLVGALKSQLPLLGVMFVLLPVFLRDTLKMSNRFAGPMYRLRTVLKQMADGGESSRIKFRTGDFWQEVAGDFNTVMTEIDHLKARNQDLESELASLRQTADAS